MRTMRICRMVAGLLILAASTVVIRGQSDTTNSDQSLDPEEQVQVVYAVYGGVTDDRKASHYVNVTDKVSDLLQKSPNGFSVTEDALVGNHSSDLCQSLLIVYNYQQDSFFYNIAEGTGTVSTSTLRSWAKTHRKEARIGTAIDLFASNDFHIVFAGYGLGDKFLNATDPVRTLIHDQPDGFVVTDDAMGGDPHPTWIKALVVIFDDPSGRHLYSMYNVGPHVSKDALLDAAKPN